jgi:hypothetical protein
MTQEQYADENMGKVEIKLSNELESRLIGTLCDVVIRLMWLSFIDPDMPELQLSRHLAREGVKVSMALDQVLESLKEGLGTVLQETISSINIPGHEREHFLKIIFEILETKDGKEQLPKLQKFRTAFSIPTELDEKTRGTLRKFSEVGRKDDTAFVKLLASIINYPNESDKMFKPQNEAHREFTEVFGKHMAVAARDWMHRVKPLTPELVSSVREVRIELIEWLAYHPTAISSVTWDAFEKIIAEVLASKGFKVELTARAQNASADIIAIHRDNLGVETKYLVECKRFQDKRRVGLNIVNGVLGAKKRAGADHALLVTTSYFTRPVTKLKESLRDLRLHLRDGDDVRSWLTSYEPTIHGGLWLDPAWDLDNVPDQVEGSEAPSLYY